VWRSSWKLPHHLFLFPPPLSTSTPLCHAVVPMVNPHFRSSQASWHHHRHLPLPLPSLRDVGIRGLCHVISIDGGLSTAGVSTAEVSTAGISMAGISTPGISTAGVSMAGVLTAGILTVGILTAGVSTVGYQQRVYQRQAIDGGRINGGLSTAVVSMVGVLWWWAQQDRRIDGGEGPCILMVGRGHAYRQQAGVLTAGQGYQQQAGILTMGQRFTHMPPRWPHSPSKAVHNIN